MTSPWESLWRSREDGSLTSAGLGEIMCIVGDSVCVGPASRGACGAPVPLVSDVGPVGSGPEVTSGDDEDEHRIYRQRLADLHSAITTPEGGPLKLATTGQILTCPARGMPNRIPHTSRLRGPAVGANWHAGSQTVAMGVPGVPVAT